MSIQLRDRVVHLSQRHVVCEGHEPTVLTTREAALLAFLNQTPNEAVSREDILAFVWGVTSDTPTRAVDVLVSRLRKRIEADPANPRHLVTEHGFGYRLQLDLQSTIATVQPLDTPMVKVGNATIDLGRRVIHRGGEEEDLTKLEAELLELLAGAQGQVVSREVALRHVWRRHTESRALDHTVRRVRLKLGDPNGELLITKRGVGLCLVMQRRAKSLLVGRDRELETLLALHAQHSWVTVVGPGGVGKTSMVKEALPEARFVDLSAIRTQEQVIEAIHQSLGVVVGEDPLGGLRLAWSSHPTVVVLDNCEQLNPDAIHPIQAMAEEGIVRTVATSRERCGGAEEVFALHPLNAENARALLEKRLGDERSKAFEGEDWTPLLERLDGLPLAVELAAQGLRTRTPQELTQALASSLASLRDRKGTQPRHSSMDSAIRWCWQDLSAPQQQVLACCLSLWGAGGRSRRSKWRRTQMGWFSKSWWTGPWCNGPQRAVVSRCSSWWRPSPVLDCRRRTRNRTSWAGTPGSLLNWRWVCCLMFMTHRRPNHRCRSWAT